MNDLQAKFAVTFVALGFIFSYAFPALKEMKHNHDAVLQQIGQPYASPDPAPNPSGANVTPGDPQK